MKLFNLLFLVGSFLVQANAQGVGFFGNTYVGSGGNLFVKDYSVSFQGKVKSDTSENFGILTLKSANLTAGGPGFVEGFVRSYFNGSFEFPIGSATLYAPIEIEMTDNHPLIGKYKLAQTPNISLISSELELVSDIESWDVVGNTDGVITLSWRAESHVGGLTTNDLSKLRIVGWSETANQWEIIPNSEPVTGTFNEGSITSQNPVDFSQYTLFTFGKVGDNLEVNDYDANTISILLKDGKLFAFSQIEPIKQIIFYDLTGKRMAQYSDINETQYQDIYAYPKGAYVASVLLQNGMIINKKIMNQ